VASSAASDGRGPVASLSEDLPRLCSYCHADRGKSWVGAPIAAHLFVMFLRQGCLGQHAGAGGTAGTGVTFTSMFGRKWSVSTVTLEISPLTFSGNHELLRAGSIHLPTTFRLRFPSDGSSLLLRR